MRGPDPLTHDMSSPHEHDLDPLNSPCCICFCAYSTDGMYPGTEALVQLACGHVFGDECLSKWISTKNTCPLCRSNVQLAFQNGYHYIVGESLSYYDLSSHDVAYDTDTDTDGESEAEDEFFDAQEQIMDLDIAHDTLDEDVWLAVAAYEENASLVARVESGFEYFVEPINPARDECFEELVECHKQWMTESAYDDEFENEDSDRYLVVNPY